MNEWMNQWRDEWKESERMNERLGRGRLQCYAVYTWPRQSFFVLPSSPPAVWLAERVQCCWKVLQSCGGYPPPSPPQPLQFMNESWENWMKKWVACERIVCAHPLLCSSGNICLVLAFLMYFVRILYIHNNIVCFTIILCVILIKNIFFVVKWGCLHRKYGLFVLDIVFFCFVKYIFCIYTV